ncbi:hypothetical protein GEMRC1_011888 [Eukaryota sp. GEM-RC1]
MIIVDPHSINFDDGYIHYNHEVDYSDLISLVEALKSDVPIKHVECRRLKYPNLEDLFALFEILSINNSVITVKIFPHLINTKTGVFCFNPVNSPQITAEEVSSLKCFLQCFNIKKLTLTRCSFTSEAISDLYDLIRVNNTLTSIDFSGCLFSKTDFWSIIYALALNSCLRKFMLVNIIVELSDLVKMFKLISSQSTKTIRNIKISHHSINFDDGSIRYNNEVDYSDLISLLEGLKSEVPIKHVECRRLKYPNLEDLFALFEILSINNSVISVDISPHLINTQTCVFCFRPTNSPQITAEEISSLKCFFDSFNIKNSLLKNVVLLVKQSVVYVI